MKHICFIVLTNTRLCVLFVRMNRSEVHLMVTSRVTYSKGLGMAVFQGVFFFFFFFFSGKMANEM